MPEITTREGFDTAISRASYQRLLVLLVKHGVPQEAAAELCLGMAELTRALEVAPGFKSYADQTAIQFEEMANMMFGGGLLPRD